LIGKANVLVEKGQKEQATAELVEAIALIAKLPQEEQIRTVVQWLDPDLRATFLGIADGVERLDALPLDLWLEVPQEPTRGIGFQPVDAT
jgi:hypothetical protein